MEVDGEIIKSSKKDMGKLIKERKQHQRWKGNDEHPDVPEPKSEFTKRNLSRIGRGDLKVTSKTGKKTTTETSKNKCIPGRLLTKKALKKINKSKKRELKEKEKKMNTMES